MQSHSPTPRDVCARRTIPGERQHGYLGEVVSDLQELVRAGRRFPTIYADPPWPYRNESSRGAAVNHYPTLCLDELRHLPILELAAPDAHLHLWTTNAFLAEALDLIDSWGFRYSSAFVWAKKQLGMGNYWRVSHEFLLLGVRGRLRFQDRTQRSWIVTKRGRHSRKPERIDYCELVSLCCCCLPQAMASTRWPVVCFPVGRRRTRSAQTTLPSASPSTDAKHLKPKPVAKRSDRRCSRSECSPP